MVITRLQLLRNWKKYTSITAKAIKEVCPDAEIYLIGGAAENRLTILSDIDLLIVLPYEPSYNEVIELKTKIFEKTEQLGLPPYTPIELHITGPETQQKYKNKKIKIKKTY